MANVSSFSGSDVILTLRPTVDGATLTSSIIEGFSGASDAIKFEENQEIITTREGMDGYVFFARTGRRGGMMTIKMLPNAPSLGLLMTHGYDQKTGDKDVQWEGRIEFAGQNLSADLNRGMMTHLPTFPTSGMSNVDDMQFSFYFVIIEAHYEGVDFAVFDADIAQ